jgi:hypothetical protein
MLEGVGARGDAGFKVGIDLADLIEQLGDGALGMLSLRDVLECYER